MECTSRAFVGAITVISRVWCSGLNESLVKFIEGVGGWSFGASLLSLNFFSVVKTYTMVRQRLKKVVSLKTVRELDAFPKVPESYVESTAVGGTGKQKTFVFL